MRRFLRRPYRLEMNSFRTCVVLALLGFSGCLGNGQTFKCDPATGLDCTNETDAGSITNRCGDGITNAGEFTFPTSFTRRYQSELEPGQLNTAGTRVNGELHWDFRNSVGGQSTSHNSAYERVEGTEVATKFPGATYTVETESYKFVYQETATELFMKGLLDASGPRIVLSPSILYRKYPLRIGSTGGTSSQFISYDTNNQMISQGTMQIAWTVDAEGILETPGGPIRVQRISEEWKTGSSSGLASSRLFVFWSDCLGPVATVTSYSNEPSAEFTRALALEYIN